MEHPIRQRGSDAEDEEARGVVPEEARAGADEEEQRGVESVVKNPGEQAEVLPDVTGDPEQREAALVGTE